MPRRARTDHHPPPSVPPLYFADTNAVIAVKSGSSAPNTKLEAIETDPLLRTKPAGPSTLLASPIIKTKTCITKTKRPPSRQARKGSYPITDPPPEPPPRNPRRLKPHHRRECAWFASTATAMQRHEPEMANSDAKLSIDRAGCSSTTSNAMLASQCAYGRPAFGEISPPSSPDIATVGHRYLSGEVSPIEEDDAPFAQQHYITGTRTVQTQRSHRQTESKTQFDHPRSYEGHLPVPGGFAPTDGSQATQLFQREPSRYLGGDEAVEGQHDNDDSSERPRDIAYVAPLAISRKNGMRAGRIKPRAVSTTFASVDSGSDTFWAANASHDGDVVSRKQEESVNFATPSPRTPNAYPTPPSTEASQSASDFGASSPWTSISSPHQALLVRRKPPPATGVTELYGIDQSRQSSLNERRRASASAVAMLSERRMEPGMKRNGLSERSSVDSHSLHQMLSQAVIDDEQRLATRDSDDETLQAGGPTDMQPRSASVSSSSGKPLPLAPPEISSLDNRVAHLHALLDGLAHRRLNIGKSIKQMTELMPPDNLLRRGDVLRRREIEKKKVEGLQEELSEIRRQEHELGLRLHRAYKRQEREAAYEPTTLWVRRMVDRG